MPSTLSKNCVTTGVIDLYCLLCAEHFLHEDKAFEHISKDKHKVALRATDCYEKFKDDFITKIRSLYYCKLCDQTFTTISKVKLHISETQHLLMKQNEIKSIERQDQDIVLFGKVVLSSNAWNGITDNTCLLCDVEFEEPGHINEEEHILNLIKSKIVFKGSFAYRQIGDTLHQCLTCNQIITKDTLVTHANTTEHENSLKINQSLIETVKNKGNEKETKQKKPVFLPGDNNDTDLVNFIDRYREQKINLNLIAKTAICKICSLNIEFKKEAIEEHIAKHNSNEKAVPKKPEGKPQKPGEENVNKQSTNNNPLEIAKQNGLMRHCEKFYCKPCHCFISFLYLKKHISSNEHKTKTIDLNNRPEVLDKNSKVSMKDIIEEGGTLFQISGRMEMKDYIIFRHKYMMMLGSFLCLLINTGHLYCQLCEIELHPEKADEHIISDVHKYHMESSQLVTAIEGEVIRQINNSRYHCGYCCVVESDWDDMLQHITTDEHYKEKIKIKHAFEKFEQNER